MSAAFAHKTIKFPVPYGWFGKQELDLAEIERALDEESRQGWELVSLTPVTSVQIVGVTAFLLAVLRRPLPDA
ncbi:MAG: DUF4177 domain-containing protein [Verrucomicrobiales bacterium]